MNIYSLAIGQIIRFALRALAIYLALGNVLPAEMQNTLIETIITDVTPVILVTVTEIWAWLQKKYFPKLLNTALSAQPDTKLETVKARAALSTKTPVIY